MLRAKFLIPFLVLAILTVLFRGDIRFWTLLFATRATVQQTVSQFCKADAGCISDLRTTVDICARRAVGESESLFVGADKRKLQYCLQNRLAERSCDQDEKCLAYLEALYEKCFTVVFTDKGSLTAANASEQIRSCINTKSYLVDVKSVAQRKPASQ